MENNIFAQWDNAVDVEGLQKDIHEAEQNGGSGNFKEVPPGNYEVSIEKMELRATKEEKKPMVSVWMKVVSDGEFKGSLLFMNQVITQGFQIHIVNEFLRGLMKECADDTVVEFKSYAQYANLLMDVHELVAESFEYGIKYGKTKKGFDTFEILEVYPLED